MIGQGGMKMARWNRSAICSNVQGTVVHRIRSSADVCKMTDEYPVQEWSPILADAVGTPTKSLSRIIDGGVTLQSDIDHTIRKRNTAH